MATCRTTKRQRSTPQARRSALLKAAEETFFTKGYAATSLDDIIALAGGSKRTIYTEFGGKEGLLTALVVDTADQIAAALTLEDNTPQDLRDTFLDFGLRLIKLIMSRPVLGLYRTIVTSGSFPHLTSIFFAAGPAKAVTNMTAVLEAAKARGELKDIDCALAANHFVGMFGDPMFLQIVLKHKPIFDEQQMTRFVHSLADMFLDGVRLCDKRSFLDCDQHCPFDEQSKETLHHTVILKSEAEKNPEHA